MKRFKIVLFFFIGFSIILSWSCQKENLKEVPTLTTISAAKISLSSISCGGNITSDGGSPVTARGVCWGTTTPTITDSKTIDGFNVGSFTSTITDLSPNKTYYFRAYATNSIGTGYGNIETYTTLAELPNIHTQEIIHNIKVSSSSIGAYINSDGGAAITAQGVCWSISPNPTITDSKTSENPSSSQFVCNLTGLLPNTSYFVRAYATNLIGTSYGNQVSFKTTFSEVTDADGNVYQTIKIGDQIWMQENLKTTKYNDGTPIPNGIENHAWLNLADSYCFHSNTLNNKNKYGALYNWKAVITGKLCPKGWHIPNDAEWTVLVNMLGGENNAGGKMKEIMSDDNVSSWTAPNVGATNESGFSARAVGHREPTGGFSSVGKDCFFWTSTEDVANKTWAWCRTLSNDNTTIGRFSISKASGVSVRCVKD